MAWTKKRVEILQELWICGISASQIALKMGGVTRNAVIGKVHRLGLSARATTVKVSSVKTLRRPQTRQEKNVFSDLCVDDQEIAQESDEDAPCFANDVEGVSILHLNDRVCKWPVGDPSTDDFYFCGAQSVVNIPYCQKHAESAYPSMEKQSRRLRVSG